MNKDQWEQKFLDWLDEYCTHCDDNVIIVDKGFYDGDCNGKDCLARLLSEDMQSLSTYD